MRRSAVSLPPPTCGSARPRTRARWSRPAAGRPPKHCRRERWPFSLVRATPGSGRRTRSGSRSWRATRTSSGLASSELRTGSRPSPPRSSPWRRGSTSGRAMNPAGSRFSFPARAASGSGWARSSPWSSKPPARYGIALRRWSWAVSYRSTTSSSRSLPSRTPRGRSRRSDSRPRSGRSPHWGSAVRRTSRSCASCVWRPTS